MMMCRTSSPRRTTIPPLNKHLTVKVLAIDPGYERLGVAVLEGNGSDAALLFSTCLITESSSPLSVRLHEIGTVLLSLIKEYAPDVVAIETLFFNKNVTTAIGVAQARGVAMYLALESGCAVKEFGPQEIKVAVTGYGKSDKIAVTAMVKRLVKGVPESAHDDEYDAIAVGITALAHHRG